MPGRIRCAPKSSAIWNRKPRCSRIASKLEARSKKHGKPSQVEGWKAGDTGSVVQPSDYQKLAGPWTNGKDPADSTSAGQ